MTITKAAPQASLWGFKLSTLLKPFHPASDSDLSSSARSPGVERSGAKNLCGHDVHTTVGLDTATMLAQLKPEVLGAVRFCSSLRKKLPWGKLDDCRWSHAEQR